MVTATFLWPKSASGSRRNRQTQTRHVDDASCYYIAKNGVYIGSGKTSVDSMYIPISPKINSGITPRWDCCLWLVLFWSTCGVILLCDFFVVLRIFYYYYAPIFSGHCCQHHSWTSTHITLFVGLLETGFACALSYSACTKNQLQLRRQIDLPRGKHQRPKLIEPLRSCY
jgi:hypothetical protein